MVKKLETLTVFECLLLLAISGIFSCGHLALFLMFTKSMRWLYQRVPLSNVAKDFMVGAFSGMFIIGLIGIFSLSAKG